jgi:hypothetical protein
MAFSKIRLISKSFYIMHKGKVYLLFRQTRQNIVALSLDTFLFWNMLVKKLLKFYTLMLLCERIQTYLHRYLFRHVHDFVLPCLCAWLPRVGQTSSLTSVGQHRSQIPQNAPMTRRIWIPPIYSVHIAICTSFLSNKIYYFLLFKLVSGCHCIVPMYFLYTYCSSRFSQVRQLFYICITNFQFQSKLV